MFILLMILVFVPAPDWDAESTDAAPSVAETTPSRKATPEEISSSIEELGKHKLAKQIYLLGNHQEFKGVLVWWHDGKEERLSYLCGPGENWSTSSIKLLRALSLKKVYCISYEGDGDIAQRLTDLPQPYDRLLDGWTILTRH